MIIPLSPVPVGRSDYAEMMQSKVCLIHVNSMRQLRAENRPNNQVNQQDSQE